MSFEHVNTCKVSLEEMSLISGVLLSFVTRVKIFLFDQCGLMIALLRFQGVLKFHFFCGSFTNSRKRALAILFRPIKAFFRY